MSIIEIEQDKDFMINNEFIEMLLMQNNVQMFVSK